MPRPGYIHKPHPYVTPDPGCRGRFQVMVRQFGIQSLVTRTDEEHANAILDALHERFAQTKPTTRSEVQTIISEVV